METVRDFQSRASPIPDSTAFLTSIMAEHHEEEDYIWAFVSRNKHEVEQLLPPTQATVIRTVRFQFSLGLAVSTSDLSAACSCFPRLVVVTFRRSHAI